MSYMSEQSIKEQNNIKLNHTDLEVIFDVLNVFTPSDISHVYPEMGSEDFLKDVRVVWDKVLSILEEKVDKQ